MNSRKSKKTTGVCLILHKKSAARPEVKQAVKSVRGNGIDLQVRIPWNRKDQTAFIDEALEAGVTRIVAGGGDGTLNGVVNSLMKKKRAKKASLGVMPLGTANDFARGAGLPLEDLTAALHIAATGEASSIDVGQANDNYFINVASGGFGAEVTATTPIKLKKALGGAAYTLMGLVKAMNLEPYRGRLRLPDGLEESGEMLVMAVGNNRYAGGGFDVAPKASLTDGLLDVAVLSPWPGSDTATLVNELSDPFNSANKYLRYMQARSFIIESDRPLHINLDGEPIIDTQFAFETLPGAISMVLG